MCPNLLYGVAEVSHFAVLGKFSTYNYQKTTRIIYVATILTDSSLELITEERGMKRKLGSQMAVCGGFI